MAREFGKRSYKPEEITFAASGNQPSGLPWSAVQRKIPKNILLQASNNPSTVEELSVELGVALPYMEEEVKLLHKATLLEPCGDRYVTNFFILDKDCSLDVYNLLRRGSKERSRLIREFIEENMPEIRALGIAREHIDDNAIRWMLVPNCIDYCIQKSVEGESIFNPPKRANGETWGFVGYESVTLPEKIGMGQDGSGNEKAMFWAYKFSDYDLWNQCGEPEYDVAILLGECIRANRKVSSFSAREKELWANIDGRYAHADADGTIVPDILVFEHKKLKALHRMLREHKNYEPLLQNFRDVYFEMEKIFKKYSHKVLHEHMGYYIRMEMYSARMMAVHDLVKNEFLKLPDDPKTSKLGMYLVLR